MTPIGHLLVYQLRIHAEPDLGDDSTKDIPMLDKSVFTPHGKHLIAGAWVAGETSFTSEPA
ncbi:hypothetical protein, partial [Salipiger mangrovisoli]|uniref:hypothetical protein n=1 Tax=Salipiger mangrovisoli TaxID=2865933 RepID=UPI00187F0158